MPNVAGVDNGILPRRKISETKNSASGASNYWHALEIDYPASSDASPAGTRNSKDFDKIVVDDQIVTDDHIVTNDQTAEEGENSDFNEIQSTVPEHNYPDSNDSNSTSERSLPD